MLLILGIVIGLLLGLTGAGGSVFAVPLLIMIGGISIHEAVTLSLAAVAAITLYGSVRNLTKQTILWLPAALLAGSGILAAPLGKVLGTMLSETILMAGFSILAILIAIRMWLTATTMPEASKVVRGSHLSLESTNGLLCKFSPTGQFQMRPKCMSGLLLGGLMVGLLSGLFGVGGGFLIIPLLLLLSQVSMIQAVSTSLVVIAFISSSGFIAHIVLGETTHLSLGSLAWLITGGLLGMFAGQLLSHRIANASLQKIFAIGLMAVSALMLFTQLI
ncbi:MULTISPECIES: sulfite exporter TauE/SafE family protein [unclassified Methylophaga]|uniref:sulfite exporter TauE/SafE family protein n=1 Tax=unclassified Methylophaga TaxID=2629249 RepID=UPI000C8EC113|nr:MULTISPECIES: sulfite exporter TauE/SafE family protein [unclassified Methylophaga]MBN45584.1 permease [Methylophaga sp.]|tara:strand:+ start:87716 stop:88540 length:825 start_codon:yes stop_codon:yes gene_type:complete